jgi:hypothetical protein
MQHRLNAGVLLNLNAQALRAHARRGSWRIRHIDGMDAKRGKQSRALNLLDAVDSFGRNDFNQRDEGALVDERADPGALG